MEKTFKRTTVTSALPYANGPVHIGHLAGVYVPADIYVRYLRLKKQEVLFIGGSDEHGVPITIRAKKEGCTPQDIVDRYHALIRDSNPQIMSWPYMRELSVPFSNRINGMLSKNPNCLQGHVTPLRVKKSLILHT